MSPLLLLAASLLVAPSDSVILRGEPIRADRPAVSIARVLADVPTYEKATVVIEGVIVKNCTEKGCWMRVASKKGETAIRVTFKDYSFFIPTNAEGMKVRADGQLVTKKHSKREAEHLAAEGAGIVPQADGTALEVTFVATGVELRR